jgi:hypothetical protein
MRICTKCEEEYEDYGQKVSLCRPCRRVYDRAFHTNRSDDTKKRKIRLQTERKKEIKSRFHKWKADKGCAHCLENDTVCLDLHHLDPKEKEIALGNALRLGWTFERLMLEASKCIVLCANCHRKEHEKLDQLDVGQSGSP